MKVAIYTRVSTDAQTTENQRRELLQIASKRRWQIVDIFEDKGISGAKGRDKRPALDAMLKRLDEFDLIAAWSVDRLGRSLIDLLQFTDELQKHGVDLYLHQTQIDTSTPGGRMVFQMLGAVANFERSMIQERVKAGLARTKANGTRLGKRPSLDDRQKKELRKRSKKESVGALAKELGVHPATVYRALK